ncbi:thiamine pyrophosphate-binding protein [Citricoccus muralis]|uniref:Thiamine pyrophosphate-dependent enzyme n=1 Tax=Citricoccus muralis TaxID=169134 RepID=A0ABY8H784_9MICC|nr:thiamine pyrophosphate-dependent enzyme [Citricoccus muralis]WFP17010.1 thiamine pyrophosphate-dependent enzyme [Citricoccus muralis]
MSTVTAPAHERPLVSHVVADVIAERSEVTFGIMGNGNAFLVGRLIDLGHRYVKARHEAGAMSMSQGFYLSTGRVSTTTTTYGPGYTNTLTVLAEAALAKTPMVLVVGAGPRTPRAFDIDQTAVATAMGVTTLTVDESNAARLTHEAYDLAARDLKPVIVSIPYDIAEIPAASQQPRGEIEPKVTVRPDAGDVARAAELLRGAQRPLIITGRGALLADSRDEVKSVGDKLNALFASSVMARNYVGSDWDLGIAGGFATIGAVELMRQADVVLVLGASMNLFQMRYGTLLPGAREIIQVNLEEQPTHPDVTFHIRSDIAEFARSLDSHLVDHHANSDWRSEHPEVADQSIHRPLELKKTDSVGRINPRALAWRLNELLPSERTIVQDGGHFLGWLAMYADSPDPHGLQHPGLTFHGIGFGFPTAVGAALARPDRLTVLTCGDGGGMMTLPDLETLVREVPKSIVVVFNDSAYGMEIHQYHQRGIDEEPMVFSNVDFAGISAAVGARGVRVTELEQLDVITEFVTSDASGTLLLDVQISPEIIAEYVVEKVEYEERLKASH